MQGTEVLTSFIVKIKRFCFIIYSTSGWNLATPLKLLIRDSGSVLDTLAVCLKKNKKTPMIILGFRFLWNILIKVNKSAVWRERSVQCHSSVDEPLRQSLSDPLWGNRGVNVKMFPSTSTSYDLFNLFPFAIQSTFTPKNLYETFLPSVRSHTSTQKPIYIF